MRTRANEDYQPDPIDRFERYCESQTKVGERMTDPIDQHHDDDEGSYADNAQYEA